MQPSPVRVVDTHMTSCAAEATQASSCEKEDKAYPEKRAQTGHAEIGQPVRNTENSGFRPMTEG